MEPATPRVAGLKREYTVNEKPEEKPAPEVRGGHTYADFIDSVPSGDFEEAVQADCDDYDEADE